MDFSRLKGKVFTQIVIGEHKDRITFTTARGEYALYHSQDCCESVALQDVNGDLADLIGTPILRAEESSNSREHPLDYGPEYPSESYTWTFYRLTTIKGTVVLRWLGESNGWYSEFVDFVKVR